MTVKRSELTEKRTDSSELVVERVDGLIIQITKRNLGIALALKFVT
jgi:hypothetical protein